MSILDKLQKLDLTVFNKQKTELKSDLLNSLKEIAANERKNLNTISNVLDNMLIKIYDCIPSSENVHVSMKEISTESKKLSESASLRYSNINLINNLIDKMYDDINQNFLTAKEVSTSAISTSERVKEKKNSIENTISKIQ
jgi:methyl-accepting chemotaxis protein